MASTAGKTVPDEAKLAALLLHKRVLTEGQLKAALDYQRSRGGRLFDVLVKLELIREQSLDELLQRIAREGEAADAEEADDSVLSPDAVDVADLKVHKRLLDKVPEELVKEYLLVLFFPSGNLSLRRIILGHGRMVPSDLPGKIRSILGVDLYSLRLEKEEAISFLQNSGRAELVADVESAAHTEERKGAKKEKQKAAPESDPLAALEAEVEQEVEDRRSRGRRGEPEAEEERRREPRSRPQPSEGVRSRAVGSVLETSGGEVILRALVSLLVKKGLISREEFEAELEEAAD